MKHIELYEKLNARYSPSLSCPWDHDGIMVMKNGEQQVKKVLIALDCSNEAVKKALLGGYDVILTHHPLLFKGLSALVPDNPLSARALLLYEKGISVFSFHTRLDCAEGGVNDRLCALLGLQNCTSFDVEGLPMGRMGKFEEPMDGRALAALLKEKLGCTAISAGCPDKKIKKLAVLGGSGGEEWKSVRALGADGSLTGEAKYHDQCDAAEAGLCMLVAGHDYTEKPVCVSLLQELGTICPDVQADVFEKGCLHTL
ncbi:MAG: Nif3-like dinuclear metal center hexameric protein [Clostridia bacterium]|nr:Nif3-like dinuclear metal center hexameric protein [Clostridia bacterium]